MTHLITDLDRARTEATIRRLRKHYEYVKAENIKRTLGIRPDAGFMRNRGWSIESALYYEDYGDDPQRETRKACACDNCFYGRDRLALRILELEKLLEEAKK